MEVAQRELASTSTRDFASGILRDMTRATHSFVGRSRELEEIRAGLQDAIEARGSLWLVTGEPGIGKSRLIEELARIAADHDVNVLWGRCWEAGGAPAYWPWIQVLRELMPGPRAGAFNVGPAAGEALSLIPPALASDLSQLLPEVCDGPLSASVVPALEPEHARFRLMDAVARALKAASARAPMMVVLEDLHAADPSSLLLLSFLARQLRDARMLVVGTFREAEAQRGDTRELFARLSLESQRLPLTRLSRADVETYLNRMLGVAPDPSLGDAVFAATEGNPLFVGELARFCMRTGATSLRPGAGLPPGIKGTIHARLMLLSAPTRHVLQGAAVIGRECRLSTLSAVVRQTASEIASAVDEATAAEVVLETAPGVLRFSHVLLQQVLYAETDDTHRSELHGLIAEQLASEGATPSERAHHWLAAGDRVVERAAQVAIEAAQHASQHHALSEAAFWYGRALEAKARARASREERCELLIALGHAQMLAHETEAGRRSCQEAATIAREQADAERFARASLAYGSVFTIADVIPALVALLQEALVLLPNRDLPLRARVMARLAAALQPAVDPEPPMALAREAIAMARRIGDTPTLLSAIVAGCSALMDLADPHECRALQEEQVRLARELGNHPEEFRGNLRLAFSAYEVGDLMAARAAIAACERIGALLAQPHYRWRVHALHALAAMNEGRFVAAEQHIEQARVLGEQAADPNAIRTHASQRITLLRLLGRPNEVLESLRMLEQTVPRVAAMQGAADVFIGAHLARAGDHAGALARYRRLGDERELVLCDLTMLDSAAELAELAQDVPMLEALYQRSLPRSSHWATGGIFGFTWDQPVQRGLGRLAFALGRRGQAARHYREAMEQARVNGARAYQAWIAHEAVEVLIAVGDHEGARALRQEADATASELGIQLPIAQRMETSVPISRAVAAVPDVTFFHMHREGEYWTLVCEGRSSRIKDGKGVAMLARLVQHAGRELHVLDLVGGDTDGDAAIDRGDAGEVLDVQARAEYRARLIELRETIEEAEAHADLARAERAQRELDAITHELARGFGLDGKARRVGSAAERARINVQRRLRDVISKIAAHDPDLGRHLEWAIKTGTYCSYRAR